MDHGSIAGMDHANMAGLDHSKMQGMDHSAMAGMGSMQGMDHSKMGNMAGMDHSKMAMGDKPDPFYDPGSGLTPTAADGRKFLSYAELRAQKPDRTIVVAGKRVAG